MIAEVKRAFVVQLMARGGKRARHVVVKYNKEAGAHGEGEYFAEPMNSPPQAGDEVIDFDYFFENYSTTHPELADEVKRVFADTELVRASRKNTKPVETLSALNVSVRVTITETVDGQEVA